MMIHGCAEDVISPKFCGTLKYCPPEATDNEKFRALPGEIWSMGILLYTLFHGGNPFFDIAEINNARIDFDSEYVFFLIFVIFKTTNLILFVSIKLLFWCLSHKAKGCMSLENVSGIWVLFLQPNEDFDNFGLF